MKRIFALLALLVATFSANAQFTTGQVLTATQLNNALAQPTITGGTINGAPVGATTPSTGAFTTLNTTGPATLNSLSVTGLPIPITSGGSGTATVFTAGSLVFSGASGVYSQNNSNLFWDNTNFRLGLGKSSPLSTIDATDPGTTSVYSNPGYNFYQTEAFSAGSNFHLGFVMQLQRTGGTGNREAMTVNMLSSAANAGDQLVGIHPTGHITAGSGSVFGANPYVWVDSGSATTAEAVGAEIDTDIRNTSVNRKVGLQVIDVATSTGSGTTFDAGIVISKQVGGKGYLNGIQFGLAATQGLQTGSTLIAAPYAFTVANGVDFSQLTISGSAFKSPGFSVSGSGVTAPASVSVGSAAVPASFAYAAKQLGNNVDTIFLQRNTDTSPTGFFLRAVNAANNANLIQWDVSGNLNNGSGNVTTTGTVTGGTIASTGVGAMPLYGTTGTGVNAPHMVQGSVALAAGTATVTLSGAAVYTSATSYTCTANDATAANAVKVGQTSGTSITLTGTTTDTVQFVCVGS